MFIQAANEEFLGITLEENPGEQQEADACMTATWRYRLLLRALLLLCGERLHATLLRQQLLVNVSIHLTCGRAL